MPTLAERDVKALLSVVAELVVLDDVRPFPTDLLRRTGDLIGGADVSYSELDRLRQRSIFQASSDGDESDAPSGDEARAYFRLANEHPVCSRRTAADDWTSVLKVSDFSSQREFERTEIWNELYRHSDVRYWMDVGIAPTGPQTRVFIFTRSDRDFDERGRLVLELLQPHLQQRYDPHENGSRGSRRARDARGGRDRCLLRCRPMLEPRRDGVCVAPIAASPRHLLRNLRTEACPKDSAPPCADRVAPSRSSAPGVG